MEAIQISKPFSIWVVVILIVVGILAGAIVSKQRNTYVYLFLKRYIQIHKPFPVCVVVSAIAD